MKLTPLDIRRNEFSRSMRGYNREEVESFLTMVADDVEGLIGEHRDLSRRLEELQKEIDEYREIERTLTETLVAAQKSADDLRESSLRDAELTRREAQVRAEQLYDNARLEAERLMLDARRKAYGVLENARQRAQTALEAARKQADEMYQTARKDFVRVEREIQTLTERRDSYLTTMRGYLQGQLDTLENLGAERVPHVEPPAQTEMPEPTPIGTDALADLDRELAAFADELAETSDAIEHVEAHDVSENADNETSTASDDDPRIPQSDEEAEVLVDNRKKRKSS